MSELVMTTARWELPCDVTSPARARGLVRAMIAAHPDADELSDDAVLLVSEVVGNVVRHARTSARLTAKASAHRFRVEVEDSSPQLPVFASHDDDPQETGRGLALLDRVAQAWGVERRDGGKVVWFELGATNGGPLAAGWRAT